MAKFSECGPVLSTADLDKAEMLIRLKLPADLREFYLVHNGGVPNPNHIPFDGAELEIFRFFSLPKKFPSALSVSERLDDWAGDFLEVFRILCLDNELFPKYCIPIAEDIGGDIFVYSLDRELRGQIQYVAHELFDTPELYVRTVAPTLSIFLDSLV